MKTRACWLVVITLCAASAVYPHAVPTHRNITQEAVRYLKRNDPRFACDATLNANLQVGTAAEDGGTRFMFHFLPRLDRGVAFATCSSLEWGFINRVCTNSLSGLFPHQNRHTWDMALLRAVDSTGAPSEEGFEELGYVLHLLEDLTSPAHVRNDPHPPGDTDPVEAITRNPERPPDSGFVSFTSPEAFFRDLKNYVQSNFWSKDTVLDPTVVDDFGVIAGPPLGPENFDYFFDARNPDRKIAYKSRRYRRTRDPRDLTINSVIANEQFAELGSIIVRYAASFIRHYYDVTSSQGRAPAICNTRVRNTGDSGPGSLRQTLIDANLNPGRDTVSFRIPGSGPHTIVPTSSLPEITEPVIIDGTTQPGYAGRPIIELNGSSAGSSNGLVIRAGNSRVRGLVINRFSGSGILISNNGGNVIEANYIGTDVNGTTASGNGLLGVLVTSSNNNLIGGTTPAARNIISGNAWNGIGIAEGSRNNLVQGNYIGTDVNGTVALGNLQGGVSTYASSDNTIGGTTAGARNIISANRWSGVGIDSSSTRNSVQGNYIGTDVTGTIALANGIHGVFIDGSSNLIGGTVAEARNIISGNFGEGIWLYNNAKSVLMTLVHSCGTFLSGGIEFRQCRCDLRRVVQL